MRLLNKLLYIAIAIGAYVIAFNDFVPSDVTMGLWLRQPIVIIVISAIVAVLLIKRVVGIIYFAPKEKRAQKLALSIFLLPSYVFIALFITIDINGLLDDKTSTVHWYTNLVFFKDMKAACISAGIDDAQLNRGDQTPNIMLVPRHQCNSIGTDVGTTGDRRPYLVTLSIGKLGIPYITAIEANH